MRLMFYGDMAATGFGTVTQDLGRAMLDLGIDVRFVSQNDTDDDLPEPFRSRTVNLTSLPWAINQLTGEAGTIGPNDGIPALFDGTTSALLHSGEPAAGWIPDAVILLGDFGATRHFLGRFVDVFRSVPTWHYVPIEGVDLPPLWKEIWDIAAPVACSEFGADEIEKIMGYRPPMLYHGVDTDVFRPVSRARPMSFRQTLRPGERAAILESKDDCKQAWLSQLLRVNEPFLPLTADGRTLLPRHWILRTDRHMPRKRYNALIRSMAPVLDRNPGWGLIIHCRYQDQGGFLPDSLSKLSPKVRSQILFTDNGEGERALGMVRGQLAILYNAADLYVSNSAEGFGLTIAEAIACGVPAVGVHYSAVPEVIGPAGVTVGEGHLLDNEYDHFWYSVDEEAFGRAVEHLITHPAKRDELGRKGPAHVRANFRWELAAQGFIDLIQSTVSTGVAA